MILMRKVAPLLEIALAFALVDSSRAFSLHFDVVRNGGEAQISSQGPSRAVGSKSIGSSSSGPFNFTNLDDFVYVASVSINGKDFSVRFCMYSCMEVILNECNFFRCNWTRGARICGSTPRESTFRHSRTPATRRASRMWMGRGLLGLF